MQQPERTTLPEYFYRPVWDASDLHTYISQKGIPAIPDIIPGLYPREIQLPGLEPARRILTGRLRDSGHVQGAAVLFTGRMWGVTEYSGTQDTAPLPEWYRQNMNGSCLYMYTHDLSVSQWMRNLTEDIALSASRKIPDVSVIINKFQTVLLMRTAYSQPVLPETVRARSTRILDTRLAMVDDRKLHRLTVLKLAREQRIAVFVGESMLRLRRQDLSDREELLIEKRGYPDGGPESGGSY